MKQNPRIEKQQTLDVQRERSGGHVSGLAVNDVRPLAKRKAFGEGKNFRWRTLGAHAAKVIERLRKGQ